MVSKVASGYNFLQFGNECHWLSEQVISGRKKEQSAWSIKWLWGGRWAREYWNTGEKNSRFKEHSLLVWVSLGSEQSIQLFCDTECKCVFRQGAAGHDFEIAHLFVLVFTEAWVVRVSLLNCLLFL